MPNSLPNSPSNSWPHSPQASACRFAPATERNREPILTVLQSVLPPEGTILEISSGTGQHAIFFASQLAPRRWQPSEPVAELRASIRAWQALEPADYCLPPLDLDVMRLPWPVETPEYAATPATSESSVTSESSATSESSVTVTPEIRAIVNINMIHIAPWEACLALLAGAGRILPEEGILFLYGPYKRKDQPMAPSNAAFDQSLRSRNPQWGIREFEAVAEAAELHHLRLEQICEMPANNLSVIFRKVVTSASPYN